MRKANLFGAAYVCILLCTVAGFSQIRVIEQFDGDLFDNPLGYEEECQSAGALCAAIDEPLGFCNAIQSPALTNCTACKCEESTPVYNSTESECQEENVAECRTQVGFDFNIVLTLSRDTFVIKQILLPDKKFTCRGKVVAWLVRLRNTRISTWVLFQVWRTHNSSNFSLVGSQRIDFNASSLSGYTDTYYRFPIDQHVACEPGDIVGMYTPFGSYNLPFENGYANSLPVGASRAYLYALSDSNSPPSKLTPPALLFYQVPSAAGRFFAFTVEESYECVNVNSNITVPSPTSSPAALPTLASPASTETSEGTSGTEPSRVADSPDAITIAISTLAPAIVGLLSLIAVTAFCICRQYKRRKTYAPGNYEQPIPSKGPSCIVGPMEYEVSVITPYATCSSADVHQYDVVHREYEPAGYETMQYVSTRAAELRTDNREYEAFAPVPADYLNFTPQKTGAA